MYPQDLFASFNVRQIYGDLAIEAARPEKSRVQNIRAIRGRDNDHTFLSIESIHLHQQCVERLLSFVMSTAQTVATMTSDCVNLINEYDARRRFLSLFEHVSHPGSAHTHKHLNEVRAANAEERYIRFTGNRSRQQSFACAGRPDHQNTLGNTSAKFLELFRILQEIDNFLHLFLRFFDAGHILKRYPIPISGQHSRFTLTEGQSALAGVADLLAKEQIDQEEE